MGGAFSDIELVEVDNDDDSAVTKNAHKLT